MSYKQLIRLTEYLHTTILELDDILNKNLYGQEIAHHVVINTLRGHLTSSNPPKALTLSFHGPPGTGKTYTSQMIAKFLYKNGDQSKFYHFFNGRNDFPLQEKVNDYKVHIPYYYYKVILFHTPVQAGIKILLINCFTLYRKNCTQLSLIAYKNVKDRCLYSMKWIKCRKVY